VRWGVAVPSMLGSQRVFQKISLPLKKARRTPASRAASTAARCARRPVLVVAHRQEDAVVAQQRAGAVHVGPAGVAQVVAVGLQPAQHGVLGC
jgi:hypothetical protein